MNFIWIGSRAPENQTRLFWFLESEFFGQNIDVWSTWSRAVTMARVHLPIQIWLLLFISPQVTYIHTKIEGRIKLFISNFASLSWWIALNLLFSLKKNQAFESREQSCTVAKHHLGTACVFIIRRGRGKGGGGRGSWKTSLTWRNIS